MPKIYIDKNDIASTMLENFDSANRRTLNIWGVFQTFLNCPDVQETLINLAETKNMSASGIETLMHN